MRLSFKKLVEILFEDIVTKLEKNKGVSIFVKVRAQFEGWLKVELCGSLSKYLSTI